MVYACNVHTSIAMYIDIPSWREIAYYIMDIIENVIYIFFISSHVSIYWKKKMTTLAKPLMMMFLNTFINLTQVKLSHFIDWWQKAKKRKMKCTSKKL